MTWLFIGVGGIIGSLGRYWVSQFLESKFPAWERYSYTLIINGTGSFFLGLILSGIQGMNNTDFILFITIGIIGSFTTYSTFSLDCVKLLLQKKTGEFFFYSGTTFGLSFAFFLIGYYLINLL